MPRTPRAREESGIHHVVVQGLDHQKIFEENEDKDSVSRYRAAL